MTLRLFVAMDVPDALKHSLGKAMEETAADSATGLKWVRPGNVHVTMKFLGNVEEEGLADLKKALREVADAQAAMDVSVGGYGAFPSARRARVFWLGLEDGAEQLKELARVLDKKMAKLGFEGETRPWAAHLTLARLRQPRDIVELLEAWEGQPGMGGRAWRGEELVLYRSVLDRSGASYTALERLRFGG